MPLRGDADRPSRMSSAALRYERIVGRIGTIGDHIQRARVLLRLEERDVADRVSQIGEDIADEITKNAKVELKAFREKMPSAEIHVVVEPPRSENFRPSFRHSIHAIAEKSGPFGKVLAVLAAASTIAAAVRGVLELLKVNH